MKQIFSILFFVLSSLPLFAQDGQISYTRCTDKEGIDDFDQNYGILLLSETNDLIVTSRNVLKGLSVDFQGKRPDGFYGYLVTIPHDSTHNPNLIVSRRGNPFNISFTTAVKPNYRFVYRIEEMKTRVRLDDISRENDVYLSETEAELQISTAIDSLQIICSPLLKAKIKTTVNTADDQIKVTKIVFPVSCFVNAQNELNSLRKEQESLQQLYISNPDAVTDSQWDRIDEIDDKIMELEGMVDDMDDVVIRLKGSNDLAINVSEYKARTQKSYIVVPIEVPVMKSECATFMSQANQSFENRKYKEAREIYNKALHSKGVPVEIRPSILASISQCDSCIYYNRLSTAVLNKLFALKKDATATQNDVARYASAASDFLQVLYNYHPDPFYKKFIDKMDELIAGMPLKVKFTVVEWRTLEEGNYIPDVELWSFSGDDEAQIYKRLHKNSSLRRFLRKNRSGAVNQVGLTNEKGVVEINLDRKQLPKGLIFYVVNQKRNIKPKYLKIKDLFRNAQGTFYEKQFRLKMFTEVR